MNGGQVSRTSPAQKGVLVRFAAQTQGVSGDQAFSYFWCGKGRHFYKWKFLSRKRNKCMPCFQAGREEQRVSYVFAVSCLYLEWNVLEWHIRISFITHWYKVF